jgi:hypothetical protein
MSASKHLQRYTDSPSTAKSNREAVICFESQLGARLTISVHEARVNPSITADALLDLL